MENLAIQLYSLRREFAANADAAFNSVPSLGFNGIELAGRYDWSLEKWQGLLKEHGLNVVAGHVGFDAIEGDNLQETLAWHRGLGCDHLVVPAMPDGEKENVDDYENGAHRLNKGASILAAEGFKLSYHNHAFEFDALPETDKVGMDILLEGTDPSMVGFEFDTYWLEKGGQNAVEFIKKHIDRVTLIHAKELRASDGADVPAGEGNVGFTEIIPLAQEKGWPVIVEFEGEGAPEAVKKSAAYLKTL